MIIKVTGYDVRLRGNKLSAAYDALLALAVRVSGEPFFAPKTVSHCASCKCGDDIREKFKEVMRAITSYPWELERSGNVELSKTIILHDDVENWLWTTLAPHLVNGSYVEISYEKPHDDGEYRIYFCDERAYTQSRVLSWPDTPSDDESELIEVPLASVPDKPKAEEAA